MLFWVKQILGNCLLKLYFPKERCVVTLMHVIIHEKGIIFSITYGELHDLLVWTRLAFFIKFLRLDFMDLLHYLQNLKMHW